MREVYIYWYIFIGDILFDWWLSYWKIHITKSVLSGCET